MLFALCVGLVILGSLLLLLAGAALFLDPDRIEELFQKLGRLKDSADIWACALPLVACVAGHYAHHLWAPLAAIAFANTVVPESEAPNAQRIHFLIAFIFTSYFGAWGFLWLPLAYAIEVFFDPRFEPDPFWPGGAWDSASYTLGAIVGYLL